MIYDFILGDNDLEISIDESAWLISMIDNSLMG